MRDEHTHPREHGHGHEHEHPHEHTHGGEQARDETTDVRRVAILVNNWIDHNEGHRRTYLEWRDKLAAADLPVTVSALERIAALTDQATAELRSAAAELAERSS